ncbi:MAG: hypothetical protein JWO72_935, partial [Caulobacteraceae bacterium]|nr:hypothetical protein [Caulobacteraceae bacterium]
MNSRIFIMSSASAFAIVSAAPVLAQAQPLPAAATSPQLNEVVVTGSRLRSGFSAPTPVTVLSSDQLQQKASALIGETLVQMPAFRQTAVPSETQRAPLGAQYVVDLRGLGVQRTLVLVNNRRFVPTDPNGTVDLNLLPTSMVDRIDVVTGGASAAYGSDAVAGAVNVVLKDRIHGIQGNVQYGVSQRGDNSEPSLSLATGFTFADGRGHVVVGGDYSDNRGVGTIDSRSWTQSPALVAFGTPRATGVPAQGYLTNV